MTADQVAAAADALRSRLGGEPRVLVVLGSGLGGVVEAADRVTSVPFDSLTGFPPTSVEGHAGRFELARSGATDILFQCGRYHLYEGHSTEVVAGPVRVAAALGVRAVVLTNAAGGIRPTLEPGDLVLLEDHINAMGTSPLVGPVREGESRFPDMTDAYDVGLREIASRVAEEQGIRLERGVYVGVRGPAFETPAEIRMFAASGADVVGMSTVPEVIVARALGLRCLGLSLVTNKAAGLSRTPLDHEEVMEVGRAAGGRLAALLTRLLPEVAAEVYPGSAK